MIAKRKPRQRKENPASLTEKGVNRQNLAPETDRIKTGSRFEALSGEEEREQPVERDQTSLNRPNSNNKNGRNHSAKAKSNGKDGRREDAIDASHARMHGKQPMERTSASIPPREKSSLKATSSEVGSRAGLKSHTPDLEAESGGETTPRDIATKETPDVSMLLTIENQQLESHNRSPDLAFKETEGFGSGDVSIGGKSMEILNEFVGDGLGPKAPQNHA
ncbi:unnamed protein product [Linum trigynum]|uniref:Uncharacterized protein n=1 Tax=Linum trigynum TaxID=586398 RepID=A0AAV2FRV9_9ROSI